MGLLDALLGRRQPRPASDALRSDGILAMGRAAPLLQGQFETFSTGRAGILLRPVESTPEAQGVAEVESALSRSPGLRRARYHVQADTHGFLWAMVQGYDLKELAGDAGLTHDALVEGGLGERLVAVVFPFTWKEKRLYWIYHPLRGRYTPFVPTGREQLRDSPLEQRMESTMRKAIPTDRDLSEWYPLWDMPF